MPTDVPVSGFIGVVPDVNDRSDEPSHVVRGKVADIADDLAEAGKRGARKVAKASEADWEEFLGVLLGYMSLLFAWFLISGTNGDKREREDLELTNEEADGLARPLARILARSTINARYGKNILGGSDYIVMAIVLTTYVERISPAIRRKFNTVVPSRSPRPRVHRSTEKESSNGQLANESPIYGAQYT